MKTVDTCPGCGGPMEASRVTWETDSGARVSVGSYCPSCSRLRAFAYVDHDGPVLSRPTAPQEVPSAPSVC